MKYIRLYKWRVLWILGMAGILYHAVFIAGPSKKSLDEVREQRRIEYYQSCMMETQSATECYHRRQIGLTPTGWSK